MRFESHIPAIINGLEQNKTVFLSLFKGIDQKVYMWKPEPDLWCLLEIVCHLYDEEIEDFRERVKHTLTTPSLPPPPIDPQGWVTSRHYIEKDYDQMLNAFLEERDASVKWLKSLSGQNWNNAYHHPKFGPLTAKMFLTNWLAHDFLHIRQILKRKYDYLHASTGEDLTYAGGW